MNKRCLYFTPPVLVNPNGNVVGRWDYVNGAWDGMVGKRWDHHVIHWLNIVYTYVEVKIHNFKMGNYAAESLFSGPCCISRVTNL